MKKIALLLFAFAVVTPLFFANAETSVAPQAVGPLEGPGGALRPEHDYRYDELSRTFQCQCGCNASIKLCPHPTCHFAIPFRKELRQLIDQGMSSVAIIDHFVSKHGEVILRAPTKEGFNLVGYLLPFVSLLLVGVALYKLITEWSARRRSLQDSGVHVEGANRERYASRLEKELSEFED